MEAHEKINEVFQEIGVLLVELVNSRMKQKTWKSAYIDQRFPTEGGPSGLSKCRVVLPNNKLVSDIYNPRGYDSLMLKAFEIRTTEFQAKDWWYGFLLTVYPDRRCEVKFFYSPDYISEFDMDT